MSEQASAPAASAAPQSTPGQSAPQSSEAPKSQAQGSDEISAQDLEQLSGESSSASGEPSKQKAELDAAEKKLEDAKTDKQKADAKKELDKVKKKFKLKVDGKEMDWEGTDEDIQRELQLSAKARKEIQSSTELKKELARFLDVLKKDPERALSDPAIGLDVVEFAKNILNKKLEDELKSPEQIEKEKLQREVEELRAKMKEEDEQRKTQEYERLVNEAERDLEEKVQEAIESSGLPKSPYVLKRMADVMLSALENQKQISPKQAMAIVKKEMHKDMKDFFGASPEDLLEELLGSENIKRLNKRQLAKVKALQAQTANSIKDSGTTVKDQPKSNKQQVQKMTVGEWLRKK